MNDAHSDDPQFIHIDDQLINLRFVKFFKLVGSTLEVTVPQGEREVTFMLHQGGAEIFERLKRRSLNYT
ncbi:MAG TPA: hypothetical protein VEX43_01000 [Chthoniobacterales bacterium]|nr:hypothetical protein [Chthoniobacterales bacterium]